MATITFNIDEALNILSLNGWLPRAVRDVKPEGDGLGVTVSGGIGISLRPDLRPDGILRLAISSKNWAYKMADSLGKVDALLDDAIRDFPFMRREGKTLVIDLNEALSGRVKGVRVKDLRLSAGRVTIELA